MRYSRRNQLTDAYAVVREAAKERKKEAGGDHGNQYTKGKVAVVELIPQAAEPKKPEPKTRDIRAKIAGTNAKYIDEERR